MARDSSNLTWVSAIFIVFTVAAACSRMLSARAGVLLLEAWRFCTGHRLLLMCSVWTWPSLPLVSERTSSRHTGEFGDCGQWGFFLFFLFNSAKLNNYLNIDQAQSRTAVWKHAQMPHHFTERKVKNYLSVKGNSFVCHEHTDWSRSYHENVPTEIWGLDIGKELWKIDPWGPKRRRRKWHEEVLLQPPTKRKWLKFRKITGPKAPSGLSAEGWGSPPSAHQSKQKTKWKPPA